MTQPTETPQDCQCLPHKLTIEPVLEGMLRLIVDHDSEISYEALLEAIQGSSARIAALQWLLQSALLSDDYQTYSSNCVTANKPNLLERSNFETLVSSNSYGIIRLLIHAYPKLVCDLANPGTDIEPPIHIAAQSSSAEVTLLLLQLTTKETALRYSSNKISLLTEASIYGPDCVVKMLTEQPYINDLVLTASAEQNQMCTALHHAALNCEYSVFKKLFDIFESLDCVFDLKGSYSTVLTFMMCPENEAKVELFIKDIGPDHPLVSKPDSYGNMPLHWAAAKGCSKVIDLLYPIYLAKGLVLAREQEHRHTFLDYLISHDHPHIIRHLLERDDFDSRLVSMPDDSGMLPMMYAIAEKRTEICKLLYPLSVSTKTITNQNKDGNNALAAAVIMKLLEVVDLFTSDPSVKGQLMVENGIGLMPLHLATYTSTPEICALIYERSTVEQVCLQARNSKWGALHWAINCGSEEAIKVLLSDRTKALALIAIKGIGGFTPMDFVHRRGPNVAAMLQEVIDA